MIEQERILTEWVQYTQASIVALGAWLDDLREWQANGGRERSAGEFMASFRQLSNVIGDGWADDAAAGGGIDTLADVVRGEYQEQARANARDTALPVQYTTGRNKLFKC